MKTVIKTGHVRTMGSCPCIGVGLTMALVALAALEAGGTTYSWIGGGAPDDNWANEANWSASAPASANDTDLVFDSATGATAINGIANPFLLRNLTFDSGAGAFTLGGSPLTIYGTVANQSTFLQTIENDITLGADSIWNAASGNLALTGDIEGGPYTFVKSGDGQLTLSGGNAFILAGKSGLAGGTLVFSGGAFTNLATGTGDAGLRMPFGAVGTTLIVTNGAKYFSPVQTPGQFGRFSLDNSTLVVSGAGTVWNQGGDVIAMDAENGRMRVTDDGEIVNVARIFIGFGTLSSSNRLEITDGGKINVTGGDNYMGYNSGSMWNSIYIGGRNAISGEKSVLNLGNAANCLSIGHNAGGANNNSLTIDAGGVLTNGPVTVGTASGAIGNSLVITNGGQVFGRSNASYVGNGGSRSRSWVGGADPVTGEKATWNPANSLIVGGSGSSNLLIIAQNGRVTNILGNGLKLGNTAGSSYNTVVVTNGGQISSLSAGMWVGVTKGTSWNRVIVHDGRLMTGGSATLIAGVTNSIGNSVVVAANGIWDVGLKGIYVGSNAAGTSSGISNSVVVTSGGIVTNACGGDRLGIGNGPGANYNSLVVTNGGKFFMNEGNVLVGAYRKAGGTLSGGGNGNVLLMEGGLIIGSINSYIGNASTGNRVELRGTAQWNLRNKTLTVGLSGGTTNELKLGVGGTLTDVGTLTVGDDIASTDNQLTLAGGNVTATTFVLGAGNAIAPVVGPAGTVAMTVTGTATLAEASTVKPTATSSAVIGRFPILTAGTLVDNGIDLDPSANAMQWRVFVEENTLYLERRELRTLLQIR